MQSEPWTDEVVAAGLRWTTHRDVRFALPIDAWFSAKMMRRRCLQIQLKITQASTMQMQSGAQLM